eukprot:2241274-Prymnesium_polylepis.1
MDAVGDCGVHCSLVLAQDAQLAFAVRHDQLERPLADTVVGLLSGRATKVHALEASVRRCLFDQHAAVLALCDVARVERFGHRGRAALEDLGPLLAPRDLRKRRMPVRIRLLGRARRPVTAARAGRAAGAVRVASLFVAFILDLD